MAPGLGGAESRFSETHLRSRVIQRTRGAGLVAKQLLRAGERDSYGVELNLRLFDLTIGVDLRLREPHEFSGRKRGKNRENRLPAGIGVACSVLTGRENDFSSEQPGSL